MPSSSKLRFAAPNLVTTLGLVFGLMSLIATYEGRFVDAGWLIIWSVLLDRLDGLVARSLRATSSFGIQMDSFADATNFGVAPGFLVYVTLQKVPALGFAEGPGHTLLLVAYVLWVVATVFRLAKFNVVTEDAPPIFFGVATTLAAGVLGIWYLVLLKYAPLGSPLSFPDQFRGPRLFGDLEIPLTAWGYLPAAMIVLSLLMVSNAPMPKLARFPSKAFTTFILLSVLAGYGCGLARYLPDFMAWLPTTWMLAFLAWGQLSPKWRALRPPAYLPD